MAENSKIEWTDHTFNPWIGCTEVSPACDLCYARVFVSGRMGKPELWKGERQRTSADNWKQPLRWNRKLEGTGRRERVFCASLADVFDNQVPPEWRADLFDLIRRTPNLDWLLLTKRPMNIRKMLPADWGYGYPNVWLGTTAENQEQADARIPHLLATPAAVRFVSCEPLLGPVDLGRVSYTEGGGTHLDALRGKHGVPGVWSGPGKRLDWVICGGESGPGARPMHPDWARSLRDQCQAAGVPFFFKQWGEFEPICPSWGSAAGCADDMAGCIHLDRDGYVYRRHENAPAHSHAIRRVGKKAAGRLLDGRTWDETPGDRRAEGRP